MSEYDRTAYEKAMLAAELMAPIVARYAACLIEAGLTRAEALALAADFQRVAIVSSLASKVEGPSRDGSDE